MIILAISPALILMAIFFGLPIIDGVRLSFSNWGGIGPITWDGLANYRATFTQSFGSSLWLTVRYSLLSMVGIIVVALVLAAAVSSGVFGSKFYKIVWFLPGVAPIAAVGLFWSLAFQPQQGAVNVVLGYLGLQSNHAWLSSSSAAIYPPIFATIWASTGFAFLLLLGAMEQIPVTLYQAARIDGAGTLRVFFSLTLPLIRPVLTVVALLELIWTFNGFTLIWAMTQGGPGYATSILPILVYKQAFQQTNFGLASAMAVIGGIILIVIGAISLKIGQSKQSEA